LVALIVIGIAALFVVHVSRLPPSQSRIQSPVIPSSAAFNPSPGSPPATLPSGSALPATHHSLRKLTRYNTSRQMTLRLPYSDGAIDTGTDTTIRVAMSRAELAALGFPLNATLHDQRVVAELTLGDDGLPRAISVSLPLEVIKEKK
jgi:hypothetical protein